jgi:hypothetical protein
MEAGMADDDSQNQDGADGRDGQDTGSGGERRDDEGLKRALAAERKRARDAEKAAEDARREAEALREQTLSADEKKLEDARREGERSNLGKVKELERQLLKYQVGAEMGLPAKLISRLQGDDRESLEADAADLLELTGAKPQGNQDDAGKGGASQDDGKSGRLDTGGGRRDGAPARTSIKEARERYKAEREAKAANKEDPFANWGVRVGGKFGTTT